MFFLAARQFVNICRKKELEIKALITGGTGTVNPSGAPHSPPVFSGVLVAQCLVLRLLIISLVCSNFSNNFHFNGFQITSIHVNVFKMNYVTQNRVR